MPSPCSGSLSLRLLVLWLSLSVVLHVLLVQGSLLQAVSRLPSCLPARCSCPSLQRFSPYALLTRTVHSPCSVSFSCSTVPVPLLSTRYMYRYYVLCITREGLVSSYVFLWLTLKVCWCHDVAVWMSEGCHVAAGSHDVVVRVSKGSLALLLPLLT